MNWFKAITTVVTVIERVVDWNDDRLTRKRWKEHQESLKKTARQVMAERYRKASNDAGKESK
jgi:hypothetical protein